MWIHAKCSLCIRNALFVPLPTGNGLDEFQFVHTFQYVLKILVQLYGVDYEPIWYSICMYHENPFPSCHVESEKVYISCIFLW